MRKLHYWMERSYEKIFLRADAIMRSLVADNFAYVVLSHLIQPWKLEFLLCNFHWSEIIFQNKIPFNKSINILELIVGIQIIGVSELVSLDVRRNGKKAIKLSGNS